MNREELSQLLNKIKNWCAYQERCQLDVREKLFAEKLKPEETDEIIAQLISENFINEERFAKGFASGKFRIKKWGKIKIKTYLKQKRISDYSIRKALETIETAEYMSAISDVLEKKRILLKKEKDPIRLKYKLLKFAQSRGFETDLIVEALKEF